METWVAIGVAVAFALGVLMGNTVFSMAAGALPLARRRAIEAALRALRPADTFQCVAPAWSVSVTNEVGQTRQVALVERLGEEHETPDGVAQRAADHLKEGPGVLVHYVPPRRTPHAPLQGIT